MTATPFVIPKIRDGRRTRLMTQEDLDRTDIREELDFRGLPPEQVRDLSMLISLNDGISRESFPVIEIDGKTVICLPDYTVLAQRAARLNAYQLHKRVFQRERNEPRRNRARTTTGRDRRDRVVGGDTQSQRDNPPT